MQSARRASAELEALAVRNETRINNPHRLVEQPLHDQRFESDLIAMADKERLGLLIAEQKAGGVTAAVKPEVKRVERPVRAGIEGRGPALTQVILTAAQQLAADSLP